MRPGIRLPIPEFAVPSVPADDDDVGEEEEEKDESAGTRDEIQAIAQ